MTRGRKPKPTGQHILQGTFRADRHGSRGYSPLQPGRPTCPTWIDKEAKAMWKRLVPMLEEAGILTHLDGPTLTILCVAWSELNWAANAIKKDGRMLTLPNGTIQTHPAVAMMRSAWKTVKEISALYGLSPSDRVRLGIEPDRRPAADDPFEAFLDRGSDPINDFLDRGKHKSTAENQ